MIVIKFLAFGLLLLSLSFAQELISKRVSKTTLDPFDKVWDQAKEVEVPLSGQAVTTPMKLKTYSKRYKGKECKRWQVHSLLVSVGGQNPGQVSSCRCLS